jgi:hypothetical protein
MYSEEASSSSTRASQCSVGRRALAGTSLPPPSAVTRPAGLLLPLLPRPLRRRGRFEAAPRVPKAVLDGRALLQTAAGW